MPATNDNYYTQKHLCVNMHQRRSQC